MHARLRRGRWPLLPLRRYLARERVHAHADLVVDVIPTPHAHVIPTFWRALEHADDLDELVDLERTLAFVHAAVDLEQHPTRRCARPSFLVAPRTDTVGVASLTALAALSARRLAGGEGARALAVRILALGNERRLLLHRLRAQSLAARLLRCRCRALAARAGACGRDARGWGSSRARKRRIDPRRARRDGHAHHGRALPDDVLTSAHGSHMRTHPNIVEAALVHAGAQVDRAVVVDFLVHAVVVLRVVHVLYHANESHDRAVGQRVRGAGIQRRHRLKSAGSCEELLQPSTEADAVARKECRRVGRVSACEILLQALDGQAEGRHRRAGARRSAMQKGAESRLAPKRVSIVKPFIRLESSDAPHGLASKQASPRATGLVVVRYDRVDPEGIGRLQGSIPP